MNSAVERAISYMWDQYGEPLTLSDLADSAALSRFHFSRTFKVVTGVSPGRFLSAVRICQAKRLLLTTSLNISDICVAVGYTSLGSFTSHFTGSVGVSPTRFRRQPESSGFTLPPPQQDPMIGGTVTGTVSLPAGFAAARAYAGIFDSPIIQRRPSRAAVAEIDSRAGSCAYRLAGVPDGRGFLHVVALAYGGPTPRASRTLLTGDAAPVQVSAGRATEIPVSLRPRRRTDLPVLLALPGFELGPADFRSPGSRLPAEPPALVRLAS